MDRRAEVSLGRLPRPGGSQPVLPAGGARYERASLIILQQELHRLGRGIWLPCGGQRHS
jgi:hypothetical protein